MNLTTLFRLLASGFHSATPRLEEEAKRIEDEDRRQNSAKETALSGFKRVGHYDDAFGISRWLREEGRGMQIDSPAEIEVWQRGEHFRLAVREKDQWSVYVIIADLTCYQMRRRLV